MKIDATTIRPFLNKIKNNSKPNLTIKTIMRSFIPSFKQTNYAFPELVKIFCIHLELLAVISHWSNFRIIVKLKKYLALMSFLFYSYFIRVVSI